MNNRNLIGKIRLLRQIEPEKDWAILTKKQIMGLENVQVEVDFDSQTVGILEFFPFNYRFAKLALVPLGILLVLATTVGLSQASLPGDFLYPIRRLADRTGYLFVSEKDQPKLGLEVANKRLEELTIIAQNNQSRNLAPAINEFKQSTIEAADKLRPANNSSKLTKEIVKETEKLRENREKIEALGIVVGDTEELNTAFSQLVEREIKDLESRSLTDAQKVILENAKQDLQNKNYENALEKILILTYPQQ